LIGHQEIVSATPDRADSGNGGNGGNGTTDAHGTEMDEEDDGQ
jgi:hypothetical protein